MEVFPPVKSGSWAEAHFSCIICLSGQWLSRLVGKCWSPGPIPRALILFIQVGLENLTFNKFPGQADGVCQEHTLRTSSRAIIYIYGKVDFFIWIRSSGLVSLIDLGQFPVDFTC